MTDLATSSGYDKCKQVIMFHNNLMKFFKSLKASVPECKGVLKSALSSYKETPRKDYILEFNGLIADHMQFINEMDEGIFSNDYCTGPLTLVPNLDFKELWGILNKTGGGDTEWLNATTRSIFKHLQVLYVSSNLALKQMGIFDESMKAQSKMLLNMLETMSSDADIKAKVEELKQAEEAGASTGDLMSGLGDMSSILGDDNVIVKLAEDLVEDLNLNGEDFSDPMAAVQALMANNGQRMQDIVFNIGQKLEAKIESGELDRDALVAQAEKMKGTLGSVKHLIPGLDKIVTGLEGATGLGDDTAMRENLLATFNSLNAEEQEQYPGLRDALSEPFADLSEEAQKKVMAFMNAHLLNGLQNHTT